MGITSPSLNAGWPAAGLRWVPARGGAEILAHAVRRALFGNTDPLRPLLDLQPLCEMARVRVRVVSLSSAAGGTEAQLAPIDDDSFVICVDPMPRADVTAVSGCRADVLRRRVSFRIAHELAHTFFFWRGAGRPAQSLRITPALERFCDVFAAELLLPRAVAAGLPFSPSSVLTLHERFDVSVELAVRACSDAHGSARAGLWWWPLGGAPRQQWAQPDDRLPFPVDALDLSDDVVGTSQAMRWRWSAARRQLIACAQPRSA